MDRTPGLQAKRPIQLKLRFGDNDNDVFASVPLQPAVRKLSRLEVRRAGELHAALIARSSGLSLRDAIARSGPLEGYAGNECE
jgi:hypothetical protein